MSELTIARWILAGLINGERVDIQGSGSYETETGSLTLDLEATTVLPDGFDLLPAQMICNVAATGYVAGPSTDGFAWADAAPNGILVKPSRVGRVHNAEGVELLHIEAVTTLTVEADGLHVDNLVEGTANLPGACTVVSASETLLPSTAGHAVGVAQFELDADGERLSGITTSPYQFEGDAVLASAVVRQISLAGSTSTRTGAHIAAQSTWASLARAGARHG